MRRNSNFANFLSNSLASVSASLKVSSSLSSTANSTKPSTSSQPLSKSLIVSTTISSDALSLPNACALSASFHISGDSNSRVTSTNLSDLRS